MRTHCRPWWMTQDEFDDAEQDRRADEQAMQEEESDELERL